MAANIPKKPEPVQDPGKFVIPKLFAAIALAAFAAAAFLQNRHNEKKQACDSDNVVNNSRDNRIGNQPKKVEYNVTDQIKLEESHKTPVDSAYSRKH